MGERGNTAYIRPTFARQVVDKIREKGGKPFLTDSNTFIDATRQLTYGEEIGMGHRDYELIKI
ncbi:MAG: DUF362 domain-containing protein [Caulobacteraceae bacterium]